MFKAQLIKATPTTTTVQDIKVGNVAVVQPQETHNYFCGHIVLRVSKTEPLFVSLSDPGSYFELHIDTQVTKLKKGDSVVIYFK